MKIVPKWQRVVDGVEHTLLSLESVPFLPLFRLLFCVLFFVYVNVSFEIIPLAVQKKASWERLRGKGWRGWLV
jgi:hypothetical protein